MHLPTNAICDDLELAPRPYAAQNVGTVSFDSAPMYVNTLSAFHSASDRHRIAKGSNDDWDGKGVRYGWRVGSSALTGWDTCEAHALIQALTTADSSDAPTAFVGLTAARSLVTEVVADARRRAQQEYLQSRRRPFV